MHIILVHCGEVRVCTVDICLKGTLTIITDSFLKKLYSLAYQFYRLKNHSHLLQ